MTEPIFSIVVPTRNRLETAKVPSVLAQRNRDCGLIVSEKSLTAGSRFEDCLRVRADLPSPCEYIRTGGTLAILARQMRLSLTQKKVWRYGFSKD